MEAMACGCAIVSTDNCMIPEIIKHGHNGLLSNDPKELRTYLEELLQNPDRARELGENARNTIVENFNLSRFVENWNNIMFDAIENKKNGAN
jgi:glycosyltransferase involved in cell wall biosynthesis